MDAFALYSSELKEILTTVGAEVDFNPWNFSREEYNSLIASLPSRAAIYAVITIYGFDGVATFAKLVERSSWISKISSAQDLQNVVSSANCMSRQQSIVLYAL